MKVKQTVAAVCLAAIVATSVGAAAKYEVDGGFWRGGTTGLLGGGTVYSYGNAVAHDYCHVWVVNAEGNRDGDIQPAGTWARAEAKAYVNRTDYSYYEWVR